MKLITRRILAAEAADEMERRYPGDKRDCITEPLARLRALGPSPDPDAVEAAYYGPDVTLTPSGRFGITFVPWCAECLNEVPAVVEVGSDPYSDMSHICFDCATKAVQLFRGDDSWAEKRTVDAKTMDSTTVRV